MWESHIWALPLGAADVDVEAPLVAVVVVVVHVVEAQLLLSKHLLAVPAAESLPPSTCRWSSKSC